MTEIEHLLDTILHKEYILQVGLKMVKYYHDNKEDDKAAALAKRLVIHDDSKIRKDEMENFKKIKSKANMKDPNELMDDNIKKAIEMHWKNNRHHPEHFSNPEDMTELDIVEMVCDWYARSIQNKTDFLSFIEIRQKNRFHFSDKMFEKILFYSKLIKKLNEEES